MRIKRSDICSVFTLLVSLFHYNTASGELPESHYYYLDVISKEHSLSHSVVSEIGKDSEGFFWFGTENGLNRYDAYSCMDLSVYGQESGIFNTEPINALYEDKNKNLWIGTGRSKILQIDIKKMQTRSYTLEYDKKEDKQTEITVYDIIQDSKGVLWFATSGGLWFLDSQKDSICLFSYQTIDRTVFANCLAIDQNDNLWLGTRGKGVFKIGENTVVNYLSDITRPYIYDIIPGENNSIWVASHGDGIYLINTEEEKLSHYPVNDLQPDALPNLINCMIPWKENLFLIGTYEGIHIFDIHQKKYYPFNSDFNFPEYPQNIAVHSLYVDNQNILWAGTRGFGIYKYYLKNEDFQHFIPVADDPASLLNKIHTVHSEPDDLLYLGTEDGLIEYKRKKNRKDLYKLPGQNKESVPITSISSLDDDHLMIGTWNMGLWLFSRETKKFSRPGNAKYLDTLTRIYDIHFDGKDDIWIGYHDQGLLNVDRKFIRKKYYPVLDTHAGNKIKSVRKIIEDHNGKIWLGLLSGGLVVYDPGNQKFIDFFNDNNTRHALTNNDILYLQQDSRNNIWIGTNGGGINLYVYDKQELLHFTTDDGIISDVIYSVKEDNNGFIWLQTNRGISRVDYYGHQKHPMPLARNYGIEDGLPNNAFYFCSSSQSSDGMLHFPSQQGLISFYPSSMGINNQPPEIVLTNLEINNRNIYKYDNKAIPREPVNFNLNDLQTISLRHNQNRFFVEFSALDYYKSHKNTYLVKLDGFDTEWNYLETRRSVSYLNLPPGAYTLKIRAANSNNVWTENGKQLSFVIMPPWWATGWAFAGYIFIFIFSIFLARNIALKKERRKNKARLATMKLEKQRELDQYKLDFFTKITHEIRTPITLIMGPLEKMLQDKKEWNSLNSNYLKIIKSNSDKLYHLTNQILDLRKIDEGKLSLHKITDDILSLIEEITERFLPFAETKAISLKFKSTEKSFICSFDGSAIDKILSNLISNAVKFTSEGGNVEVDFSVLSENNSQKIILVVRDSGKGISEQEVKRIFKPFYQSHESDSNVIPGTGIGLSMVKELVELHKGRITVESQPEKGSSFIVELPVERNSELKENIKEKISAGTQMTSQNMSLGKDEKRLLPERNTRILVVEDNRDLNEFLCTILKDKFKIYRAFDGKEAYRKALKIMPDLILSDVMMPVMDGVELCSKIKANNLTCHIPFIMLTVKSNEKSQLEGLYSGADDYIFKPFNTTILQAKINNVLNLKE
ncbi:MAG: two-component regulator propeller domain-containing protein, partial [Bacteroidota bacterium]